MSSVQEVGPVAPHSKKPLIIILFAVAAVLLLAAALVFAFAFQQRQQAAEAAAKNDLALLKADYAAAEKLSSSHDSAVGKVRATVSANNNAFNTMQAHPASFGRVALQQLKAALSKLQETLKTAQQRGANLIHAINLGAPDVAESELIKKYQSGDQQNAKKRIDELAAQLKTAKQQLATSSATVSRLDAELQKSAANALKAGAAAGDAILVSAPKAGKAEKAKLTASISGLVNLAKEFNAAAATEGDQAVKLTAQPLTSYFAAAQAATASHAAAIKPVTAPAANQPPTAGGTPPASGGSNCRYTYKFIPSILGSLSTVVAYVCS